MKRILLVCAAGMSTSLLVNKMKEAAKNRDIEVEIEALPISECSTVIDEVDIVLLGPQVRFQKPQVDELVNGKVPVEVIDMKLYGRIDGEKILDKALNSIEDY